MSQKSVVLEGRFRMDTGEGAKSSSQVNVRAGQLSDLAGQLKEMVGRFKV